MHMSQKTNINYAISSFIEHILSVYAIVPRTVLFNIFKEKQNF